MPAAKRRKLALALAALAVLVGAALPVGASIPRPGDQLLEPDPEALLAALEASPDPPRPEPSAPDRRFELLAPAAVDRLLFTGRSPQLHLFAELETRVRASDLLSLPQPLEIKELTLRIAPGDRETGLYYAKARYYDPELGIFLTEDPALGQIDTPPSLHRYLYAYQNPTVYVDPTGRVTELKEAAEATEEFGEGFIESAEQLQTLIDAHPELARNPLVRVLTLRYAVETGGAAGVVQAVSDALSLANFVANVTLVHEAVVNGRSYGDVTDQALAELNQNIRDVEQIISILREDPNRVGVQLLDSAKQYLEALARGDLKAVAQLSSTVTQIGLEILVGDKGTQKLASTTRRSMRLVREFEEEMTEELREQTGRIGREMFRELPEEGVSGDDVGKRLRQGVRSSRDAQAKPTPTDRLKEQLYERAGKKKYETSLQRAREELAGLETGYDHVTKVRNAQRGLRNRIDQIKRRLSSSSLDTQQREALEAELSQASELLEFSERFVPKVEE